MYLMLIGLGLQKQHMISTTSYATKWYITLFSNSVPFQTSLRLWDAFLLEGQDLFVIVAIAIIWAYRGTDAQTLTGELSNQMYRTHHLRLGQFRDYAFYALLFLRARG